MSFLLYGIPSRLDDWDEEYERRTGSLPPFSPLIESRVAVVQCAHTNEHKLLEFGSQCHQMVCADCGNSRTVHNRRLLQPASTARLRPVF